MAAMWGRAARVGTGALARPGGPVSSGRSLTPPLQAVEESPWIKSLAAKDSRD